MLIVGGCEARPPAASPSTGRDVGSASPGGTTVVAPKEPAPPPAPPDGSSPLGPEFPIVKMWTQTTFAHDHGDMTTLERVAVAGEPCPPEDVLQRVVAHWGGWTPAGGRSDEDVLRTTRAFIEAWDGRLGAKQLTGDEPPDDLASYLGRGGRAGRGVAPGEPPLVYHPPRYELRGEGGVRLVVASYFVEGHISQRGRHWTYRVWALRVEDGARHPIGPDSALPRPRAFSEGD